jgi:protein-tyrosine phosphatase
LPPFVADPDAVYARGAALVESLDAARRGRPARSSDELDDPWSCGDRVFARVADEIEEVVRPLAQLLLS